MALNDTATKDGYDVQVQTNHLSHFLLTSLLMNNLLEGQKQFGDTRVVQHSSLVRKMSIKRQGGEPLPEEI